MAVLDARTLSPPRGGRVLLAAFSVPPAEAARTMTSPTLWQSAATSLRLRVLLSSMAHVETGPVAVHQSIIHSMPASSLGVRSPSTRIDLRFKTNCRPGYLFLLPSLLYSLSRAKPSSDIQISSISATRILRGCKTLFLTPLIVPDPAGVLCLPGVPFRARRGYSVASSSLSEP